MEVPGWKGPVDLQHLCLTLGHASCASVLPLAVRKYSLKAATIVKTIVQSRSFCRVLPCLKNRESWCCQCSTFGADTFVGNFLLRAEKPQSWGSAGDRELPKQPPKAAGFLSAPVSTTGRTGQEKVLHKHPQQRRGPNSENIPEPPCHLRWSSQGPEPLLCPQHLWTSALCAPSPT